MIASINIHHVTVKNVSKSVDGFYIDLGEHGDVAMFFSPDEWEKFVSDVNAGRSELEK